jgi:DNA-binding MarR family transcriptional regulator
MPNDGERPLVSLLGLARDAFVADFERRLAESDFPALSLAHSANVLRHLGDGPRQASQIVSHCEVSKQAVSQQILQLAKHGYVTVAPHPTDHRARMVTLTERGERAQSFALRTFDVIESEWCAALGPTDGPALRRILTTIVDQYR